MSQEHDHPAPASAEHSAATPHPSGGHDDHGHHGPWFVAHHFETAKQQFDACKLGVWAFLVQEILFFSGLFCAYAVYRANHPEIYQYAYHFLDWKLGAVNTIVLLFSSFTMALGVRYAQLGQRLPLVVSLGVTLLCAGI